MIIMKKITENTKKKEANAILVKKDFKNFGTDISLQLLVDNESKISEARKDLLTAENFCSEIEKIFSRFDLDSELMKINSQLGMEMLASDKLLAVAKSALKYYAETDGYFDPRIIEALENTGYDKDFQQIGQATVKEFNNSKYFDKNLAPDLELKDGKVIFNARMDFAGVVKGFAVDELANFFDSRGWKNFFVDCGGDMYFSGENKNSEPWYIDIEGASSQSVLIVLKNKGIATSGIGKRKWEAEGKRLHHLIDPKNPEKYSFDLKSVTVIADSTEEADVWAKTLFILGKDKIEKLVQEKKLACAVLYYNGNTWLSSEFKKYLFKKNA